MDQSANIPEDLHYTESHEWVRTEEDGTLTIGITDYAQSSLGDVVHLELPKVGATLEANQDAAVVESVKAASDVYSPISGTVVAVNEALSDKPETINEDAYGEGWIFVVQPSDMDEVNELLSPDDYAELLEDDDH